MNNKEKCNELKKIRKHLADELNIDLHQTECTFEGECSGTCPKCKQEEKVLNSTLLKKGVVVLSTAALTFGLAACTPQEPTELSGDVEIADPPVVEDLAGEIEEADPNIIVETPPTSDDLAGDVEYIGDN